MFAPREFECTCRNNTKPKKGGVAGDNHGLNHMCSCERAISSEARVTGNAT